MNRKMVFYMIGQITKLEAALLAVPLLVSLIFLKADGADGLRSLIAIAITLAIALAVGFLLTLIFRTKKKEIFAKEGFVITAMAWIVLSAIGALPFVIAGAIPNYIDAFFETVSGFTTTGASILRGEQIESMSHGLLFWRSFTHWMGGMGILVLIVALLPTISGRTIHVLRAEMPGPTMGKLVPKLKDTAKILYLMYLVLTVAEIIFLLSGGMPVFDSVIHSLGTAGTGGFGIRADSLASYSPYCQWVITVFMLLFGVNFNLYYLLLFRRVKGTLKSEELWTYFGLIAVSMLIICLNTASSGYSLSDNIRTSAFQVASFITTTGYGTTDVNSWPVLSKTVLLMLMFIGGCAGSTAGGLKISRVVLMVKKIRCELRRMIHPRSVNVVRFEGKKVEDETLSGVTTYFAIYMLLLFAVFFIISFDGFSIETNFSAAASTFNNIGPAFDAASGGFFIYSPLSKLVMSFAMLLGRLEIYPLLLLFSVSTWKGK